MNADGYLGVIRLDGIELQCGELECAFLIAENREFETIKPFVPYSEQRQEPKPDPHTPNNT